MNPHFNVAPCFSLFVLVVTGFILLGCDDDGVASRSEADSIVDVSVSADVGDVLDTRADLDVPVSVEIETLVDGETIPLNFGEGSLAFQVDDDVLSLAVTVYGTPNGWYGIDAWQNGDDTNLITPNWPSFVGNERGCFSCANFTNQGAGAATTIVPNRSTASIVPGLHRLSVVGWVGGFSAEEVLVRVVAKTGTAMPETGRVDLNFYLTGAQGWNSETIQTDTYFAACIARVNELYGRIGIDVGSITFYDIDASFAVISIEEGDMGLEQLVSQSIQGQSEGVNIFLVDEILTGDPDYPSIPGVSASVPNPPYLPGTTASGVAIALRGPLSVSPANRFLDPPAIGQTIAHELGHALGLFHTSEYDLVTHDIYEDTPENDSAWLMHADGTGDQISPTQRQAIFANPIVQHVDP